MNSFVVMYTTAALMAFVAVACTALCFAWSIPSWRHRLRGPELQLKLLVPSLQDSLAGRACRQRIGFNRYRGLCRCRLVRLLLCTERVEYRRSVGR